MLTPLSTYVLGVISTILTTSEGSRSATCVFGRIYECIARPLDESYTSTDMCHKMLSRVNTTPMAIERECSRSREASFSCKWKCSSQISSTHKFIGLPTISRRVAVSVAEQRRSFLAGDRRRHRLRAAACSHLFNNNANRAAYHYTPQHYRQKRHLHLHAPLLAGLPLCTFTCFTDSIATERLTHVF